MQIVIGICVAGTFSMIEKEGGRESSIKVMQKKLFLFSSFSVTNALN